MNKRKIALFISEAKKIINISAFLSLFITIASFVLMFAMQYPDSTGFEELNMKPHDIANISGFIIASVILFWIVYVSIYFCVKDASPLVKIYPPNIFTNGKEVSLEIKTTEPHGIKKAYIEIISLFDVKTGLEHSSVMNSFRIIKIKDEIVKNESKRIVIADTIDPRNKFNVRVNTDKQGYFLTVTNKSAEYWEGEYKLTFKLYSYPNSENRYMLSGVYEGVILQKRYNMPDGQEGDFVTWKPNSFKEIEDKSLLKRIEKVSLLLSPSD